ncbi:MAG: Arsenical resistance operon repressor, partial [uncultured Nocardioidaceae bacterium]
ELPDPAGERATDTGGCHGSGPEPQGPGRSGPSAAAVLGGRARGRRGLRVRPHRTGRPEPADDLPPPQGPRGRRPPHPRQAGRVGLLLPGARCLGCARRSATHASRRIGNL